MIFVNLNNTPVITHSQVKETWVLIDGKEVILGNLASEIAMLLRGKRSPKFTSHMNMNINVVVINGDLITMTRNKWETKTYVRHSGAIGGRKEETAHALADRKGIKEIIRLAVEGMLPGSRLSHYLLRNLYIYGGAEHPHQSQNPQKIDVQFRPSKGSLLGSSTNPNPKFKALT